MQFGRLGRRIVEVLYVIICCGAHGASGRILLSIKTHVYNIDLYPYYFYTYENIRFISREISSGVAFSNRHSCTVHF